MANILSHILNDTPRFIQFYLIFVLLMHSEENLVLSTKFFLTQSKYFVFIRTEKFKRILFNKQNLSLSVPKDCTVIVLCVDILLY